jgi:membrane-associated phospholipid phosphatase
MIPVIDLISKNSFYYKTCLIMMAICGFFLCFFTRANGFIILNSFHTYTLNDFFEIITFLGDGIFTLLVVLVIFIFFKKYRNLALLLLVAYISSGIFSQILKNIISAPRPSVYFQLHSYKYYLDTFTNSRVGFKSFPSGHTATAFATATIFATYLKRKSICIFSIFFAFLIGYSRIYLAHHFLIDVLAGAIVGILFGTLSILWFDNIILKFAKKIRKSYMRYINWNNSYPNSPTTN